MVLENTKFYMLTFDVANNICMIVCFSLIGLNPLMCSQVDMCTLDTLPMEMEASTVDSSPDAAGPMLAQPVVPQDVHEPQPVQTGQVAQAHVVQQIAPPVTPVTQPSPMPSQPVQSLVVPQPAVPVVQPVQPLPVPAVPMANQMVTQPEQPPQPAVVQPLQPLPVPAVPMANQMVTQPEQPPQPAVVQPVQPLPVPAVPMANQMVNQPEQPPQPAVVQPLQPLPVPAVPMANQMVTQPEQPPQPAVVQPRQPLPVPAVPMAKMVTQPEQPPQAAVVQPVQPLPVPAVPMANQMVTQPEQPPQPAVVQPRQPLPVPAVPMANQMVNQPEQPPQPAVVQPVQPLPVPAVPMANQMVNQPEQPPQPAAPVQTLANVAPERAQPRAPAVAAQPAVPQQSQQQKTQQPEVAAAEAKEREQADKDLQAMGWLTGKSCRPQASPHGTSAAEHVDGSADNANMLRRQKSQVFQLPPDLHSQTGPNQALPARPQPAAVVKLEPVVRQPLPVQSSEPQPMDAEYSRRAAANLLARLKKNPSRLDGLPSLRKMVFEEEKKNDLISMLCENGGNLEQVQVNLQQQEEVGRVFSAKKKALRFTRSRWRILMDKMPTKS